MKLSSKKTLAQLYNERKKSYKSLISISKRLSLSSSANLKINKDHLEQRESIISSNVESQQSNLKHQVQTIIINGEDYERNIQNLNQASSFIENTPSNKISNNSGSNFDDIKKIITNKFSLLKIIILMRIIIILTMRNPKIEFIK